MINSLIFPAPEKSTYTVNSLHHEFADLPASQNGIRLVTIHIPPLSTVAKRLSCATSSSTITSAPTPNGFGVLLHHPSSPFLVIYAHPNAVDVGIMLEEMSYFARKAQVSVLMWEYHGYGILRDDVNVVGAQSDAPEPGEEVLLDGVTAVYRYVVEELLVPPTQIILMGRSIGTGPSTWLASQTSVIAARELSRAAVSADSGRQVEIKEDQDVDDSYHVRMANEILKAPSGGHQQPLQPPLLLFLQAPFSSIVECVRSVLAQQRINLSFLQPLAGMIIADRFRNADRIGSVDSHVLIQHGDEDTIVTYDHAVRLVQAATAVAGKQRVVHLHTSRGYGHNNLSAHEAVQVMRAMLNRDSMRAIWSPHPLNIRIPVYHLARHSVFERLCGETGSGAWNSLGDFHRSVIQHLGRTKQSPSETPRQRAEVKLRGRSTTATIVVASVASFVCQLVLVWSHIRPIERKIIAANAQNLRSAAAGKAPLSDRASLQRVFEEFIAVNGSPLGVYSAAVAANSSVEVDQQNPVTNERHFVVFGLLFGRLDATDSVELCSTLLELRWPHSLVRDVLCMVETLVANQPTLVPAAGRTDEERCDGVCTFPGTRGACAVPAEVPFTLSKAHMDQLQLHVERLLGFLPDSEWVSLQQALRNVLADSNQTIARSAPGEGTLESIRNAEANLMNEALLRNARVEESLATAAGDAPTALSEKWDQLLQHTRRLSTSFPVNASDTQSCGVVVRQDPLQRSMVASLDPSWSMARRIHRQVLLHLRRGEGEDTAAPPPPLTPSTTGVSKKKSDDDCCMM